MIYQHLFDRVKHPATVRAGVIGVGQFASPTVTQSVTIPRLDIPVLADLNPEPGRLAYIRAGIPDQDVVVCSSRKAALNALATVRRVVLDDASLMMDLPIDVIVSATRSPEGGAFNALAAVEHGKHVVMVDQEADSVVGSILKHLADRAGVVFTTDDGDEPGLAMGPVSWARALGMHVLSAGNMHGCLWDPASGRATSRGIDVEVPAEDRWALERIPMGQAELYAAVRKRLFSPWRIDEECGDPLAHMAVLANGTGLLPDQVVGHRPVLRYVEVPEVLCPVQYGGVLHTHGAVDIPTILYREDDPSLGGDVFVVVANDDTVSRETIIRKGAIANQCRSAIILFRPHHLCGAETAMSILCAGLLQIVTDAAQEFPHVDVVATAARDLRRGEALANSGMLGWDQDLKASLVPGFSLADNGPVPFFVLKGNRLVRDVPTGTVITVDMIAPPEHSVLWPLRHRQDSRFFGAKEPGQGGGE